ncbi:ATP synthase F1 subunit epsilon [Prosthecobacter dejongeii]|uniref:ATP synthase epsilon chain n=1 Tax=Prosthecobacter dejongeii TaxID=48465 RepID=A0A7W7YNN8_9BACT|nr:ATP synthase F1 subunit epsilon [Prosthecobacter dejongeii]MBB5039419.1 F-type H+-transporting ATPase subunit epsilon [Prosthecobacter dejongeii]
MPLKLEIVTPEARIFSDEVDTVVLPGFEGEMGVLPSHAPLVTTLQVGELRYTKGGKTTELAVGEGLVEVTGSTTRVLTDMALSSDEIDEKAVEEAMERAKHSLESLKHGEQQEEVAAVMAMIQRSAAQLQLKRKRKSI